MGPVQVVIKTSHHLISHATFLCLDIFPSPYSLLLTKNITLRSVTEMTSYHRHNRQFRYEERDNNGVVHGRYGYYDQYGKLNIVNYTADPYKGFHAEGEHVPKPQY